MGTTPFCEECSISTAAQPAGLTGACQDIRGREESIATHRRCVTEAVTQALKRTLLIQTSTMSGEQKMGSGQFKLSRVRGIPVTEAQLIEDLRRVAVQLGSNTVSQPQYSQYGRYDMRNLSRRLGGWDAALSAAGLGPTSYQGEYADEDLFANILSLWQYLGRQPRRVELASAPSKISQSPYQRRFGSWSAALEAFVEWANSAESAAASPGEVANPKSRTARDPSLRLRFKVLLRDNFTCCGCGKSPATSVGTILHVDHVLPWSKGGETVLENLRTLCSKCNIGKSNVL